MIYPIKIMQVTFGLEFGGLEQVIYNLCRFCNQKLFKITVCCLERDGFLAKEIKKLGIAVESCTYRTGIKKYLRALEVQKLLKKHRTDIVHTHNTTAYLDGIVAAKFAHVPIIIHTDHCRLYPDKKRYMIAERIASMLSTKIVAVSKHTKSDLEKWEKIKSEKIIIIYNGIPQFPEYQLKNLNKKIRFELGIDDNNMIVGSVGRLEAQKNYDLLIKAASIMCQKIANVKFVIIGDGSKRLELEKLIREQGLQNRIILAGWKTNIIDYIKNFDIFVMTSNFEGMPIVLLEAMATKKPIIATNVGGVPEMIESGKNGNIVLSHNPVQFADEIQNLLTDKSSLKRYGENGYQIFANKFTVEKMIQQYEHLYLDCYRKYLGFTAYKAEERIN